MSDAANIAGNAGRPPNTNVSVDFDLALAQF